MFGLGIQSSAIRILAIDPMEALMIADPPDVL